MIGLELKAIMAGALGLALSALYWVIRRSGRKDENAKQIKEDRENADEIRDRVRDLERVQPDDIEFRD